MLLVLEQIHFSVLIWMQQEINNFLRVQPNMAKSLPRITDLTRFHGEVNPWKDLMKTSSKTLVPS